MSAKQKKVIKTAGSSKPADKKPLSEKDYEVFIIGETVYKTTVTKKFKERKKWERPDEKEVCSLIPGTIKTILVEEGQEISEGDPLIKLEAMKMLNTISSPVNGTVKKIHVDVGQLVNKDMVLISLA